LFKNRRFRWRTHFRFNLRPWVTGFALVLVGTFCSVLLDGWSRSMSAQVSTAVAGLPDEAVTAIMETELPRRADQESNRAVVRWMAHVFPIRWDDPTTWVQTTLPSRAHDTNERKAAAMIDDKTSTEAPPPDGLVRAAAPEEDALPAVQVPSGLSTRGKKVVFIYHTHNREAYLPDLKGTNTGQAYDEKTNITLVGRRLAEELEKRGIGAEVSTEDYWPKLNGKYHLSYAFSRKTVEAAVTNNRDLKYILDIHRDAMPRAKTTRTIGGVDYAAILFVVGKANQNWRQNEQFALQLHHALEKLYPGLSKGVTGKSTEGGRSNGEYNQSVHPNSILVEIGGHENTLEEAYRSVIALADALAMVYWEAEAVDGPVTDSGSE